MLQFTQATVKEWPSFKKFNLKGNYMQATLSQRQAQYLVTRLSVVAQAEQQYRQTMRMLEGISWAGSDKDMPDGEAYFNRLNTIRDNIRDSKNEEAKLNECIRQLRKVR